MPSDRAKQVILIAAQVALVVIIVALLAANWIPIMLGPNWYRPR